MYHPSGNTSCTFIYYLHRSASSAPAGTHNAIDADPRTGREPFPKPRALVLPMVKFGQAKPDGLGHTDTTMIQLAAISSIINSVSQFFTGAQARRAGTPPISSQRLTEGFMRFFFKRPVITSPHISDQFIAYTGNTDLAILLNKDTLTLWFSPSRKTPQAKVLGVWSYSSFEVCCDAIHFLEHRRSHFALYTSTMLWPRNVTLT